MKRRKYFFERIKNIILKFRQKSINKRYKKQCVAFGKNIRITNPNVKIGENVFICSNVKITGTAPIMIGNNVGIGDNVIIHSKANDGLIIGSNSFIAANCYIIDLDHGVDFINGKRVEDTVEQIIIGENVWIGANCVIAKGSKIGNGATIGAGSFVKGIVPEYAVAVGSPAKVIRYANIDGKPYME